jgi:hypothetical protein
MELRPRGMYEAVEESLFISTPRKAKGAQQLIAHELVLLA